MIAAIIADVNCGSPSKVNGEILSSMGMIFFPNFKILMVCFQGHILFNDPAIKPVSTVKVMFL